jgi:hypothetical protein
MPVWFTNMVLDHCIWCTQAGERVLAHHNCSVQGLVKGLATLCTCRNECNKHDLIAAQSFYLTHHTNQPRWFALVTRPPICCSRFSFMGGVAKDEIPELGCEKHFSRWHTEHHSTLTPWSSSLMLPGTADLNVYAFAHFLHLRQLQRFSNVSLSTILSSSNQ